MPLLSVLIAFHKNKNKNNNSKQERAEREMKGTTRTFNYDIKTMITLYDILDLINNCAFYETAHALLYINFAINTIL